MAQSVQSGDLHVDGNLTAKQMGIPTATVVDDDVAAGADIAATKLQQQRTANYAQVHGSAATTERKPFHSVKGATGTVVGVRAALAVANVGDSTVSVDVLKNGTTILSSPISLTSSEAAYAFVDGTVSVTSLAAGDVLEADVTATVGTGTLGQGLIVEAVTREDPS